MDSQKDTIVTKHYPCLVLGVFEEKDMIPDGWNSPKKASNTQQTNGPVEDMLYKKEMNPDGRNSKMEASNSQHELSAKDKKVMIPGGWNSQGRQAILTILTLFKVP